MQQDHPCPSSWPWWCICFCDGWAITSGCSLSLPFLRLLGGTLLFGIAGSLSGITGHQIRILTEKLRSQRSCSSCSRLHPKDECIYILMYGASGEGNGNPLQYSCLENPMDRGAWWTTIHGVAKSRTRLSDFCVCVCVCDFCVCVCVCVVLECIFLDFH